MSGGGLRRIRSTGLPTRVRLVERVGAGNFGEVWLARDTREGIDVAVKFLDHGSAAIDGQRFEREVRSLARLSEIPGVVAIRDLGIAPDGTPWLVTEFLRGGSLRFRLDVEAPAPWSPEAVALVERLLLPLASTLAAAHEVGVFHGDIAPGNVLFDEADQPRLTDFGMAALGATGSGGSGSSTLEVDGPSGFTPAYAAPERLRGTRPGPRSDVYSLAATLWHVLAGDPRLVRADAGRAQVDGYGTNTTIGLLEAAMDKAPGLRPSAEELVEALAPRVNPRRWWRYRRADGQR